MQGVFKTFKAQEKCLYNNLQCLCNIIPIFVLKVLYYDEFKTRRKISYDLGTTFIPMATIKVTASGNFFK